jgi:phosphoglucomutase
MSDHINYNKGIKKLCKFGCTKTIQWSSEQKGYVETDTGLKHFCPNLKHSAAGFCSHSSSSAQSALTQDQVKYMDSIGPVVTEVLRLSQENNAHLQKIWDILSKLYRS